MHLYNLGRHWVPALLGTRVKVPVQSRVDQNSVSAVGKIHVPIRDHASQNKINVL